MTKNFPNQDAWKRLGDMLQRRRFDLGGRVRGRFATERGLRNDRILFDIEKGIRANYEPGTLTDIERVYEIQSGNIEEILSGGELRPALPAGAAAVDVAEIGYMNFSTDIRRCTELWQAAAEALEAGDTPRSHRLQAAAQAVFQSAVASLATADPDEARFFLREFAKSIEGIATIEMTELDQLSEHG